jgi:hypothetical protein
MGLAVVLCRLLSLTGMDRTRSDPTGILHSGDRVRVKGRRMDHVMNVTDVAVGNERNRICSNGWVTSTNF